MQNETSSGGSEAWHHSHTDIKAQMEAAARHKHCRNQNED